MTNFDKFAFAFFAVLTMLICTVGMYANAHNNQIAAASLAALSLISLSMTAWSGRKV